MTGDRKTKGEAMRARLWGPNLPRSSMPERVARYTNDHLFGDVWQDPALTTEEHSLITCAVLVALGRDEQQRVHFRGARNLGIPREKLEAMIGHVMHYAGWPTGATASRVLKEVCEQMDGENKP
jgi:4-carboxymuconolactone decarboxylase